MLTESEKAYLKQCCKDGLHDWVKSTADGWEICSRSWCHVVRKVLLTPVENGATIISELTLSSNVHSSEESESNNGKP